MSWTASSGVPAGTWVVMVTRYSMVKHLLGRLRRSRGPPLTGSGSAGRSFRSRSRDELLPAVDVVRRAGQRRVDHDVHGERGDVGGFDHAPDGQRRAELVAALVEVVAEQRRGKRRVDEAGGDEVDPDRRDLQRE